METLRGGTYIFGDHERLTVGQRALAASLWDQLSSAGPAFRLLNNPRMVLGRYDFLRTLYDCGANAFNVYRVIAGESPTRFPVFLRLEDSHTANLTPLLSNSADLETAIIKAVMQGVDLTKLLIVEFCDTAIGDGFYRKRSVFRIGEKIFPHHMHLHTTWVVKNSSGAPAGKRAQEEMEFLHSRDAERVFEFFELAQIQYGRIDYAVAKGRSQVWEINTNPGILPSGRRAPLEQRAARRLVVRRLKAAFESIDFDPAPSAKFRIRWDPAVIRDAVG
jgi:hypothetical protein